ncbi:MAG: squalene synthase HpnC [Chloroflexota bacterium]
MAVTTTDPAPLPLAHAYARCAAIARGHYENFTVVSWLLPRRLRASFHTVYAFCRLTDDLGDEASGDRLAALDAWEAALGRALTGEPPALPTGFPAPDGDAVLTALADATARHGVPPELYARLIEANRMDQRTGRFATHADLLHYCEHSATPVGRMVLALAGEANEANCALSDATCTALQLANFWQDVARDHAKGRIYLPAENMARFGVSEADIAAGTATPAFRELMSFEVARTRDLFAQGLPLARRLGGRIRLDVLLFSQGGIAVLDAIEAQGYDVLTSRPTVSGWRKAWLALSSLPVLAGRRAA